MSQNNLSDAPLQRIQHVVVLMLENRSFDNLLGFLYDKKDSFSSFPLGKQYAGLHFDGPYSNPIPPEAGGSQAGPELEVMPARDYFQPFPDPGEFYPHVNTQLYNTIVPESNWGKADDKITAPFNLPPDVPAVPPMKGFIRDYVSVLRSLPRKGCLTWIFDKLGINPRWFHLNDGAGDYKSIMECYTPEQVPVMATLAKAFAVFDHWHCDVPSQTYTNRSFWHAGTASGYVNNSPLTKWIFDQDAPTLFNLLENKGIPWNIYSDNPISLTGIIHFKALKAYHETNFKGMEAFLEDAQNGNLPAYSFVEPRFFTPHNDQHPSSYDSVMYGPAAVGSVKLGELLIWEVYEAIRNSPQRDETLLIITHDEHGGCFDHVPPPAATPPVAGAPAGENGFRFDRLGIRVPMIMISAYIQPNTIVNDIHHHTSFLHTMCKKWGLEGLTDRDKTANSFEAVFTGTAPRADWPVIPKPEIGEDWSAIDFSGAEMNHLEESLLAALPHVSGEDVDLSGVKTTGDALRLLAKYEGKIPGAKISELRYPLK